MAIERASTPSGSLAQTDPPVDHNGCRLGPVQMGKDDKDNTRNNEGERMGNGHAVDAFCSYITTSAFLALPPGPSRTRDSLASSP